LANAVSERSPQANRRERLAGSPTTEHINLPTIAFPVDIPHVSEVARFGETLGKDGTRERGDFGLKD
jgi:hypothetical protein